MAPLLCNRRCHGNILCPTRWEVVPVLASKYEVDVTTRNGVMVHFT